METRLREDQYDLTPLGKSGLGGWLIFIQLGLILTLLLALVNLFSYSIPSFYSETWTALTSKDSLQYHHLWAPTILFEFLMNIGIILFSAYIIVRFYQRKMIVPRLIIVFYSASLLISVFEYILMLQIPDWREIDDGSLAKDIAKGIFTCLIWIPYFLRSVRVKNTFVK